MLTRIWVILQCKNLEYRMLKLKIKTKYKKVYTIEGNNKTVIEKNAMFRTMHTMLVLSATKIKNK